MRKAIFVALLVLGLVLVAGAAPFQNLVKGVFFTDPLGNDADASIVYTRVSDNETMQFKFTTSDTVGYTMDAANFYVGPGGSIMFEGSSADASEISIAAADVTADVTLTLPLSNGANAAFMVSELTTNSPEVSNSVWTRSNAVVWEGSTENASESIMSSDNVGQDVTYTLRDISAGAYTFGEFSVSYCTGGLVTASIDVIVFLADRPYTVTAIDYVHQVKESADPVAVMPERLQGTEDVGAGDDLLSAEFDSDDTANNTVLNGALTTTTVNLSLAAGDRIGLDFTGDTPGELANVCVTFNLVPD